MNKTVAQIRIIDTGPVYRVEKDLRGATYTEQWRSLEIMAEALRTMLKHVCTDEGFERGARLMAEIILNGRFDDEKVGED